MEAEDQQANKNKISNDNNFLKNSNSSTLNIGKEEEEIKSKEDTITSLNPISNDDFHQLSFKPHNPIKISDDEINNEKVNRSISMTFVKGNKLHDSQNNIRITNTNLDFVDINAEHTHKPHDSKFDEVCSICSRKIFYIKYICCICLNCNLCEFCEREHYHPWIKCKSAKLSTLPELVSYISLHQMSSIKQKNGFNSLFDVKINYKLSTVSTQFAMRPNKRLNLPINIENLSNTPINHNIILTLISRNSKDLIVYDTQINHSLNKKEQIECQVPIQTSSICKIYDFKIEWYSQSAKLEGNALKFHIEVNEDEEEEEINNYFKEYPKILSLPKSNKMSIKEILEKKNSSDHPYIIMSVLRNNQWNVDEAVSELKSMSDSVDVDNYGMSLKNSDLIQ